MADRAIDIPSNSSEQTLSNEEDFGINNLFDGSSEEFVTTSIPSHLSAQMQKACEPQMVSLGPLHFGKSQLLNYQKVKEWLPSHTYPYRSVRHLKKLVEYMKRDQFMTRIRNWYRISDSVHKDKNLCWMMTLDGLFLLQLLREISPMADFKRSLSSTGIQPVAVVEDNLKLANNVTRLCRPLLQSFAVQEDIMKLDNQIPIFALQKIVLWDVETYQEMMKTLLLSKEGKQKDLILQDMILQSRTCRDQDINSILRQAWHSLSPFPDMHDTEDSLVLVEEESHILGFVYENIIRSDLSQCNGMEKNKRTFTLPSAVELKKKGVKFTPQKGLLNKIRFDGRTCTFHLPRIEFDEKTYAVMRNLLAFEASIDSKHERKPLRSYVELMDYLINKGEDVEVLRNSGIIHRHMGSDEEVAGLWNGIMGQRLNQKSEYEPIDTAIDNVIKFYRSTYRIWYEEFKQKYLSRPWLTVSLIAGCILMVLTVLQTILSWEQLRRQT